MSDESQTPPLETQAAEWLAAEDAVSTNPDAEPEAVRRGLAYEAALAVASLEEKRLAWEAARVVQASREIGSRQWAAARRVSELLRVEYSIARELEGSDLEAPPEPG